MFKTLNGRDFEYTVNERGCHVPNKKTSGKAGYVKAQFGNKHYYLHRLAYAEHYGIKADGVIMHNCDNPACFNPLHLSLGTQADNNRDRHLKGGYKGINAGSSNGKTTLNEATVRQIYVADGSIKAIAEQFGVTAKTVENIRYGYTWKYATANLVRNKKS